VEVVIEIEKGSKFKNELKDGVIVAREKMRKPMAFDCGYIPGTWQGDNMELDAFFVGKEKHKSGEKVHGYPIGVIEVLDNGEVDNKIVVCDYAWKGDKVKAIKRVAKACKNKPNAKVVKVYGEMGASREISRCKTLFAALFKK
jgi:inorganic pyrophosphatase